MFNHIKPLGGGIGFDFQWLGLLMPNKYNWIDFDFIRLSFEYDGLMPQFEMYFGLLGISLYICIDLPWSTEASREIMQAKEDIESGKAEVVPYNFENDAS